MEPGIYPGRSFEEYCAIPAWNRGSLLRLRHSPAAAKYELEREETLAMKGGSLAHQAVLEPELFESSHVVMPKFMGNMNDDTAKAAGYVGGKQAKKKWMEENEGLAWIDEADRNRALSVAKAVKRCAPAAALLYHPSTRRELTVVWDDPLGPRCKMRLDAELPNKLGGSSLLDLKKTKSTLAAAFEHEIFRLALHLQAAFYLRGWRVANGISLELDPFGDGNAFAFLAFESRKPHFPAVFQLDAATLETGAREVENMLRVVAWCERTDRWPDNCHKVRVIGSAALARYSEYRLPEEYTDAE